MSGDTRQIQGRGDYERYEALANGAVSPGHLVELDSNSKVKVHATAGGWAELAFAVEDSLQGDDVTDSYADGDLVQYNIQKRGNIVWCRIKNGESVSVGDKLVSAGNGEMQEFVSDSSAVIVEQIPLLVALEACDMSDSSAADPNGLCKARVL